MTKGQMVTTFSNENQQANGVNTPKNEIEFLSYDDCIEVFANMILEG